MWLTPHLRDPQPEGERERERESVEFCAQNKCLNRTALVIETVIMFSS